MQQIWHDDPTTSCAAEEEEEDKQEQEVHKHRACWKCGVDGDVTYMTVLSGWSCYQHMTGQTVCCIKLGLHCNVRSTNEMCNRLQHFVYTLLLSASHAHSSEEDS